MVKRKLLFAPGEHEALGCPPLAVRRVRPAHQTINQTLDAREPQRPNLLEGTYLQSETYKRFLQALREPAPLELPSRDAIIRKPGETCSFC